MRAAVLLSLVALAAAQNPVPAKLLGTWTGSLVVAYGSPGAAGKPFVCIPDNRFIVAKGAGITFAGTTMTTAARDGAQVTVQGVTYIIPADTTHTESFVSYDNTTNILTLSDGSGSNDCIYMQVNDPHHVKVVVMDAVSFDRCNTKNYDPWRDQPRCQGSMSAGTFVANKIAWLTKQA